MVDHRLRTFLCVADCGSLSRAARQLFLTPTAVMKQIDQLESRLGVKLIVRTNRGVALTPAGESLYADGRELVAGAERAVERARRAAAQQRRVIRVGTSLLNPCKVFMDLWNRLGDRLPQYSLRIVPFEDDHRGILSVIERIGKDFDFIVGVCNSAMWLSRCDMLPLGRYRQCVALPEAHRLAGRAQLKLDDLNGETLMMVRRGDSPVNDGLRDEIERNHPGIHLEDTEPFYDIDVFNRCAQTGRLLLSLECWRDVHPMLKTVLLNVDWAVPYGLLYAKDPPEEIAAVVGAVAGSLKEENR